MGGEQRTLSEDRETMPPFWRRPKWVAGHVLAAVTVVAFVALGFWQLDRLEQRRAYNALVDGRAAAEPASLDELLALPPGEAAYRPVRLTGSYDPAGEILLSLRSRDGRAGHHVLTPLRVAGGRTVVVDRGWVPMEWDDPPLARAAPPEGTVEVRGVAQPGRQARRAGRFDGGQGPLQFVSEVDLERIAAALGEPVAPVYVVARSQRPAGGEYPVPAEPPPLGEGNHLSYAVQWFLFAGVVAAGYPLLLRRTAREQGRRAREPARPPAPVGP